MAEEAEKTEVAGGSEEFVRRSEVEAIVRAALEAAKAEGAEEQEPDQVQGGDLFGYDMGITGYVEDLGGPLKGAADPGEEPDPITLTFYAGNPASVSTVDSMKTWEAGKKYLADGTEDEEDGVPRGVIVQPWSRIAYSTEDYEFKIIARKPTHDRAGNLVAVSAEYIVGVIATEAESV